VPSSWSFPALSLTAWGYAWAAYLTDMKSLTRDADAALADEVLPVVLVELGTHLGPVGEGAVDGLGEVGPAGVDAARAVHGPQADSRLAGLVVEEVRAGVAHGDGAGRHQGALDAAGGDVVDAQPTARDVGAHGAVLGGDAGLGGSGGGLRRQGGGADAEADGQEHDGQGRADALHAGCQGIFPLVAHPSWVREWMDVAGLTSQ
jgi:hypothetical protein